MKITKITNGPLKQNCYVLSKGERALVIDPGLEINAIVAELEKQKLRCEVVLLTHGHFDHIYGAKTLQDRGAKVYISAVDAPKLLSSELALGFICGINDIPEVLPDGVLTEGKMKFLDEEFEIVFTPGHTLGSVVVIYKDYAFTGDTYFAEGVYGRCDLPGADERAQKESIKKLLPLLKNKNILSGHE